MTTTQLIEQLNSRLASVRAEISRMEVEQPTADQYRQLSNSGALAALGVEAAFLTIVLGRIDNEGLVPPTKPDEHVWMTDLLSDIRKENKR